ncbi:MAG: CoA-binding protein [Leptospiraceae bacterium]|nr:CoA-binding protein [Leptospiraceae bacterium]MCP5503472.1 CoA-binding protein [Leptospiraceae bacterium]
MDNEILRKARKNDNLKVVLVGATNDRKKFGNIIFRNLKDKDVEVFPINPKASTIEGHPVYHKLSEIESYDIINIVIPPKYAFIFIKEAVENGHDNFWLQPGAESPEILEFLTANGKKFVYQECIMVEVPGGQYAQK